MFYISEQKKVNSQDYCTQDSDCILVLGCGPCFPCEFITISDTRVLAVNKNNFKCPEQNPIMACAACIGSIDYDPNKDAVCINNKCTKKPEGELIKNNLENIFYNSRCYQEDLPGFGKIEVQFKIDKIYNVTIVKTGKNYALDFPKGNFTEIEVFSNFGGDLITEPIDYITLEKQNISAWRVQGGVFGVTDSTSEVMVGVSSFNGCLEIIDSTSGKILTQGLYGYS